MVDERKKMNGKMALPGRGIENFKLEVFNFKIAIKLESVQPQPDHQPHCDPNADKHPLHHRADRLVAFR